MPDTYREARSATLNFLSKFDTLFILKDKLEAAEDAEAYVAEAEARRAKVESEIATLAEVRRVEDEKLHAREVQVADRLRALDQQLADRKALLARQVQAAQADQEKALAEVAAETERRRQAHEARIAQSKTEAAAAASEVAELERRITVLRETEAALRKSIGG